LFFKESATQICQSDLLKLHDDKEYNIVDTPGLFDTKRPDDEVLDEIAQSIVQCSHGVAAILFVIGKNLNNSNNNNE